jgi:hypothetical protein
VATDKEFAAAAPKPLTLLYRWAWIGASQTPNTGGPRFDTLLDALEAGESLNADRVGRGLQPCPYLVELGRQRQQVGRFEITARFRVDLASLTYELVAGTPRGPLPSSSRWVMRGTPGQKDEPERLGGEAATAAPHRD